MLKVNVIKEMTKSFVKFSNMVAMHHKIFNISNLWCAVLCHHILTDMTTGFSNRSCENTEFLNLSFFFFL